MAKRFGRNQRRALKARITELEAERSIGHSGRVPKGEVFDLTNITVVRYYVTLDVDHQQHVKIMEVDILLRPRQEPYVLRHITERNPVLFNGQYYRMDSINPSQHTPSIDVLLTIRMRGI